MQRLKLRRLSSASSTQTPSSRGTPSSTRTPSSTGTPSPTRTPEDEDSNVTSPASKDRVAAIAEKLKLRMRLAASAAAVEPDSVARLHIVGQSSPCKESYCNPD